nr:hypothetical protein [Legionella tunisiensis]
MNVEKIIVDILAATSDKTLGLTIPQLGLQSKLTIENNQINLTLAAGFPTKLLEDSLIPHLSESLQQALPNYQIQVSMDFY